MGIHTLSKQEYLYGKGAEVDGIPAEIIMRRVATLEENMEELYKVHYMHRDEARIRAVDKAIRFWRNINEH